MNKDKTAIRIVKKKARRFGDGNRKLRILDLGCGNGGAVHELLAEDFDAFGVDLSFKDGEFVETLKGQGRLLRLHEDPYSIPFDDASFDILFTDNVLEHVADLESFMRESARVLKSGGLAIHYYPSWLKFREPHTDIPLGTLIQRRSYVRLWFRVGFKNIPRSSWRNRGLEATYMYLLKNTSYRPNRLIAREAKRQFSSVSFEGQLLLENIDRGIARGLLKVPFGPSLFNTFWSSLCILTK